MSLLESIAQDLRALPPMLLEISRHIHRLLAQDDASASGRRAALRATAGTMPGGEGEDFERAVRETSDRRCGCMAH